MGKNVNLKSFGFGVLLGAAAMFSVGAAATGERASWEYKQVQSYQSDQQLNELARQGWIVDQVEKGREGTSRWDYYLLKRPRLD